MRCSPILVRLVVTCCILNGVRESHSADWPEFRGPSAQGIVRSTELPTHWSKTEGVVWRTELPGEGWSSPIEVDGVIYLTAAIPKAESGFELVLLLLDSTTGGISKSVTLFDQPGDAPGIHKKNSHASPTPVFDGESVFVHFGHQGTACCTTDGTVRWTNDRLSYPPVHGNGGSPVVVGELLVFSRDCANISQVTALDKRSGEVKWTLDRNANAPKQFSFCTPLLIEVQGELQLVVPGSNVVQGIEPATGRELWRVRYEGYSVVPRPIYANGLVFISTGYDRPVLLAIDPTGLGDITESHLRWTASAAVPKTASLVSLDGAVAMVSDSGIVSCLDAITGEELWKKRVGGNFSSSPLLIGHTMYVMSEEGVCTLLDIGREGVSELAVNELNERCLATPAVIDGDLLVRTSAALYRLSR